MPFARTKPTKNADSSTIGTPTRTGSYGEAYVVPVGQGRAQLADEGSYFVATNATAGTAITAHAAPAIADTDTKTLLHIFNAATASTMIYLDYIKLSTVVANASATAVYFMSYIDNKGSTAKTSGGTVITPVSTRSDSGSTTNATMTFGAVLTTFTSSKKVGQWIVKPTIGYALDQYLFQFGEGVVSLPVGIAVATATGQVAVCSGAPIVIAPGGNYGLVQTSPSGTSTAATFEFEIGYWER
jgi:hypothetical protein